MTAFAENITTFNDASPVVQELYNRTLERAAAVGRHALPPAVVPGYDFEYGTYDNTGMEGSLRAFGRASVPVAGPRHAAPEQQLPPMRPFDLQDADSAYINPMQRYNVIYNRPGDRRDHDGVPILNTYAESTHGEVADMEKLWDLVDEEPTKTVATAAVWKSAPDTPSETSNNRTEQLFAGSHDIIRHRSPECGRVGRLLRRTATFIGCTVLAFAASDAVAASSIIQRSWHR